MNKQIWVTILIILKLFLNLHHNQENFQHFKVRLAL